MLNTKSVINIVITARLSIVRETALKIIITIIIVGGTVVKIIVTAGQTICRGTESKQQS